MFQITENSVSERDLRTHPSYLEQTRGTLKKNLNMTIGYYRFIGIIKKTLMHYSRHTDSVLPLDQVDGYFDEPDYANLALMNDQLRDECLVEMVRVVCTAYDTEWWYILLQRAIFLQKTGVLSYSHGIEYPKELSDLPRTVHELRLWLRKQGGATFVSLSTSYNQGEAFVQTKEHLTQVSIRDFSNTLEPDSKSKWAKFAARHVAHFLLEEMGRVRDECADDKVFAWLPAHFQDVFAEQFVKLRRKAGDTTDSIIWPTSIDARMIRWRDFGPRIVRLRVNQLPNRVDAIHPLTASGVKTRDVFFKNLVYKGVHDERQWPPQINRIICMRLYLHIEIQRKREVNGEKKVDYRSHYRRLKLPNDENLLIFFDDEAKLLECMKDMKKIYDNAKLRIKNTELIDAAEYNKSFWLTRLNDLQQHELFHYNPGDSNRSDDGFAFSGNHLAFGLAQTGIITGKMLSELFELRNKVLMRRFTENMVDYSKAELQDLAKIGNCVYSHT